MTGNPNLITGTITTPGTTTTRTIANRLSTAWHNVMDNGALADGSGALLSTRFGSLAAAQAVYPFVTSTGVTIDWTAITASVKWNSLFTTATANATALTTTFASLNSYSSGTGIVSIHTAAAHGLSVGQVFITTAVTGTGANIASLIGTFVATAGTTGSTLNYNVGTGLTITTVTGGNLFGTHNITVTAVPASVQASPQSFIIKDLNQTTPLLGNLNPGVLTATSTVLTMAQPLLLNVTSGDIIEFVQQDVGTIYIPFGHYVTNQVIDFDGCGSIIFTGDGRGSLISANFAGFILDRPGLLISGPAIRMVRELNFSNISTSAGAGCLRMLGNDAGSIRDCVFQGHVGVDIAGSQPPTNNSTCFDTHIMTSSFVGLGTWEAGSFGVGLGPETAIYDCAVINFEHGIRAFGGGVHIRGCRIERNKVGIYLGIDGTGVAGSVQGGIIEPISLEANDTGIWASVINGCLIAGFTIQGSTNSPSGASAYGIRWDNGTSNTFQDIIISADTSSFTTNGFYINPGSTFSGSFECVSSGSQVGANWSFTPSPQYNFLLCNNPTNAFPFASLPTPVEGMQFDITNDNSAGTFGAAAVGGGTRHARVRYNGTTWTIMGV